MQYILDQAQEDGNDGYESSGSSIRYSQLPERQPSAPLLTPSEDAGTSQSDRITIPSKRRGSPPGPSDPGHDHHPSPPTPGGSEHTGSGSSTVHVPGPVPTDDGLGFDSEFSRTSRCKRVFLTRHSRDVADAERYLRDLGALCTPAIGGDGSGMDPGPQRGNHDEKIYRYVTGQVERCPRTGRIHVQAVVCSWKQYRFSAWKRHLGPECHFKGVRDFAAAVRYVTKTASRVSPPVSYGDAPSVNQGTRNDLEAVRTSIANGASTWTLMNDHFSAYARYGKFFSQFKIMCDQRQRREEGYVRPDVFVYYGESGSGKSRRAEYEARQKYGDHGWFRATSNWFDGYDAHEGLILDDFYGYLTPSFMLQLLDGYSMTLPVKHSGSVSKMRSIWITSNEAPEQWWSNLRSTGKWVPAWDAAFRRRFTRVVHHTAALPWTPPTVPATEPTELA